MPPIPEVLEKKEGKFISEVPQVKTEEIQPTPPISEKMEDKPKAIPKRCKLCGTELNNKATFCPQCGKRVKK
ncbi:hypothetical protein LCGC14_2202900 [marine sediment metagenome]|uniref:Zinc-ribbon domain-containing protein n=1 Tax=marine sediment metagenome TaxID=412755 RepID=A0A0F9E3H7_9ZZZZ